MGKLKEILKEKDVPERRRLLKDYACEAGLSSNAIVESESQLIDEITTYERHQTNVKLTTISVIVASALLIWGIIYTFFIYPPKYVLDGTNLYFSKWFGGWVEQERKNNPEVNIYNNSAEFELHFILQNKNRGEGEVSKPDLIISAENSEKKFEVATDTSHRTIKVGSYGIVDEFFTYGIRESSRGQKEIVDFLRENKDKLKFKIKGKPYGEIEVKLIEDYID